jgi:transmembrane sensor
MSLFQKIFQRYLRKRVSPDEQRMVDGWYHSYDSRPDYQLSAEEEIDIQQSLWRKLQLVPYKPKTRVLPVISIAASLVIIIGLGWMLLNRTEKPALSIYQTHSRQYKTLQLPDGSSLHLHPASSVSFIPAFNQTTREVWMPEGEVYYSVAKDSTRPFIIHPGRLQIRVLGTAFCIRTIKGIKDQEVVVKSGKVQVNQGSRVLAVLTAGKRLIYDSTLHRYQVEDNKAMLATQLENGWFVLSNTSFADLQVQLKNRFDVSIEDSAQKLQHAHFTTAFPPQATIHQVMQVLTQIHRVQYRIEGNTVIIN